MNDRRRNQLTKQAEPLAELSGARPLAELELGLAELASARLIEVGRLLRLCIDLIRFFKDYVCFFFRNRF